MRNDAAIRPLEKAFYLSVVSNIHAVEPSQGGQTGDRLYIGGQCISVIGLVTVLRLSWDRISRSLQVSSASGHPNIPDGNGEALRRTLERRVVGQ